MTVYTRVVCCSLLAAASWTAGAHGFDWKSVRTARAKTRQQRRSQVQIPSEPQLASSQSVDAGKSHTPKLQLPVAPNNIQAAATAQPLEDSWQAYEAMNKKEPLNAIAYHRLGVMSARAGKYTEAHQYFRSALDLSTNNPTLLSDIGYCYYLEGHLDAAERALRHAANQKTDDSAICNNLGLVLGVQGKFEESLAQFRRVGSESEAYANLAHALKRHSQFGQPTPSAHSNLHDKTGKGHDNSVNRAPAKLESASVKPVSAKPANAKPANGTPASSDSAKAEPTSPLAPLPQRLPAAKVPSLDAPPIPQQVIQVAAVLAEEGPLSEPRTVSTFLSQSEKGRQNPLRRSDARIANATGDEAGSGVVRPAGHLAHSTRSEARPNQAASRKAVRRPVSKFAGPADLLFETNDATSWDHDYPEAAPAELNIPAATTTARANAALPYQRGKPNAPAQTDSIQVNQGGFSQVQQGTWGARFELSDQGSKKE